MESSDNEFTENLSEKYALVEFKKRGPQTNRIVEIVLCKWIRYDQMKKKLFTKFLPSSSINEEYTDDDRELIDGLLKAKADAPESWSEYLCYVKDVSDTFDEAENKIGKLNKKENAFSTDSDMDSEQKALQFAELIKKQTLENQKSALYISILDRSESDDDRQNQMKKPRLSKKRKGMIRSISDTNENGVNFKEYPTKKGKSKHTFKQVPTSNCTGRCSCCEKLKTYSEEMELKDMIVKNYKKLNKLHDISIANFTTLAAQINELKGSCQMQKSNVQEKLVDFAAKNAVHLPCERIEDLDNLELVLENEECNNDLKAVLKSSINRLAGVGKTTAIILRLLLSREIAMKCTAQKPMINKYLIKNMLFTKIVIDVLMEETNIQTDKQALRAIGDALSNSKDWDGHRILRAKNQESSRVNLE